MLITPSFTSSLHRQCISTVRHHYVILSFCNTYQKEDIEEDRGPLDTRPATHGVQLQTSKDE